MEILKKKPCGAIVATLVPLNLTLGVGGPLKFEVRGGGPLKYEFRGGRDPRQKSPRFLAGGGVCPLNLDPI